MDKLRRQGEYLRSLRHLFNNFTFYTKQNSGYYTNKITVVTHHGDETFNEDQLKKRIEQVKKWMSADIQALKR